MKKTSKPKSKPHATSVGFHFIEDWKRCRRYWYIEHLLGIVPAKKAPMLIFGGAFHSAKATFYKTKSEAKALATFTREVKTSLPILQDADSWGPFLLQRGPIMLRHWIADYGNNDLAIYKFLGIEQELTARLPNGYVITGKPDVVVQNPSGDIYVFETKTSFFSANLQEDAVELGDQTTTYLYLWRAVHGKKPLGVVPDIIAWSRNSTKEEQIEMRRGKLVTRSDYELSSFERGVMSDLLDMSGRVRALSTHAATPEELFPRTTSWCLSYNRRCSYADICREHLETFKSLPGGFTREKSLLPSLFKLRKG